MKSKAHQRYKLPDRVCEHCGEEFHIPPKEVKKKRGRFCSRTCYFKFRKAKRTIKCDYCRNLFERNNSKRRFCGWGCFQIALAKGRVHAYKQWVDKWGYLRVGLPGGSKFYHRQVAGKALGRELKPHEIVHHINGNKLDNRNKNLLICEKGYHRWLHHGMAKLYMEEHLSYI